MVLMVLEEDKSIPHEVSRSHWPEATSQCVERYLVATVLRIKPFAIYMYMFYFRGVSRISNPSRGCSFSTLYQIFHKFPHEIEIFLSQRGTQTPSNSATVISRVGAVLVGRSPPPVHWRVNTSERLANSSHCLNKTSWIAPEDTVNILIAISPRHIIIEQGWNLVVNRLPTSGRT